MSDGPFKHLARLVHGPLVAAPTLTREPRGLFVAVFQLREGGNYAVYFLADSWPQAAAGAEEYAQSNPERFARLSSVAAAQDLELWHIGDRPRVLS
jgi:hypothetical protein